MQSHESLWNVGRLEVYLNQCEKSPPKYQNKMNISLKSQRYPYQYFRVGLYLSRFWGTVFGSLVTHGQF